MHILSFIYEVSWIASWEIKIDLIASGFLDDDTASVLAIEEQDEGESDDDGTLLEAIVTSDVR
jgi:hypothetical protein